MMSTIEVRKIVPSSHLENVRYAIRDLAVLADEVIRQGKKVLPLNLGDPLKFDFATPPHLIDAVAKAMRDGKNGYSPSSGIPEAIEAIRAEYEGRGIRNIQDIFVTSGASEAVDICMTTLLDEGQNILCPSPEYPLYSAIIAKLRREPNSYMLDESNGWEPSLEDIAAKITSDTRGIVIINPNNPTGAIYSRKTLEGIAEIARRNNLIIFADEIYDKLILEGEHLSMAVIAPDVPVVTFGGMSKNYLAPGWRIGWAIVSGPGGALDDYVEANNRLLRARLCANHPEQYAIKPALQGPQDHLQETLKKLRSRRQLTLDWVESNPRVTCVPPNGAFYAFPKLDIPEEDEVFVKRLLLEKNVLVVNGSGFTEAPGTRHIRIVYLPNETVLSHAYQGISELLNRYNA